MGASQLHNLAPSVQVLRGVLKRDDLVRGRHQVQNKRLEGPQLRGVQEETRPDDSVLVEESSFKEQKRESVRK